MASDYDSSAIEVLTGLEPVRKRPGMYTATERPNHLVQEVVDNSVDEAIAGYCKKIEVTVYKDGSVEIVDDGRGMPVDIHPRRKNSWRRGHYDQTARGAVSFLTRAMNFQAVCMVLVFQWSTPCLSTLRFGLGCGGKEYNMAFANGLKTSDLEEIGTVGLRNTGTKIRFWPDAVFFDSPNIHVGRLCRLLRAKAVLSPGLTIVFEDEAKPQKQPVLVL